MKIEIIRLIAMAVVALAGAFGGSEAHHRYRQACTPGACCSACCQCKDCAGPDCPGPKRRPFREEGAPTADDKK